ncbi:hypothetical protein A2276_06685 [candidate division WOR-1 bacterium RIFOXYA12_FULL_43_27]|uniref:Type III pantothenate kinase n=1 Tax=candidate division WOR-1 bacterium RIFOXYC2_FULL_46_14 TaxID=1802587 RepID=A0A1F4U5D6_UNCSA|nr:MAG: hypothetical protein A2276_06685 [candidate division WOR-1 bacterium RIFOXYA12_FULL_43_27]OGC20332.1 MAG: hypothetical protein A2292_04685 [candidate division WOR-1 bacterium RIFOXYB2_FULL_46_45]OGC31931.1 MAG: hypothetical protein A2232_06765 [candidate division WOR-1 bacterium RIFOXYA2_FULL_46_56]OGC40178.1 MAG: hypothetical protein A2438_02705 [candidate division WOR-1 bacterium RIFOXYC2_FULL_46_14]
MLLAIDVGNSTTTFGLFEGVRDNSPHLNVGNIRQRWGVETKKLSHNLPNFSGDVIVSSVVPKADKIIKKRFPQAHFVTAKNIKGIKVKAKKSEVGADRVVNALAAYKLYGAPSIVVDFGTATTFDMISAKGEYLGGAISPGIGLAAKILHQATAKLPEVVLAPPKRLIGKNTREAILSGLVYGYVSLVEGMIARIKSETLNSKQIRNPKSKIQIIATGGFAGLIAKHAKVIDIVDQDITLKGLMLLKTG